MSRAFAIMVFAFMVFVVGVGPVRAEVFVDLPDEFVMQSMQQMRPVLKDVQINQQFIGEESAQELSDPLLNLPQAEEAMVRGVISLMAQKCSLDWQSRSFDPYMSQKQAEGYGPKEAAFAGLLHNFSMKIMGEKIGNEACTSVDKQRVRSFLYY